MTLNAIKNCCAGIPLLLLYAALLMIPSGMFLLNARQAKAADIPEWVQNIKISGDFRFRYQTEEENADGDKRNRYRIRFRPGATAKVTDNWELGFGLATGGLDPRSTNQTLTEFATYDIRLDYAYGKYSASDSVDITFGKMKNPIWGPKDLMWDDDVRPDGVAAPMTFKSSDKLSWFVTPAYFVLGELREKPGKDDNDFESMGLIQTGIDAKITKEAYLKLAATAYKFNDIVPGVFDADVSSRTNTEMIEGAYAVDAEIGYKGTPIMVALFGQYVVSDADNDKTGYLLGAKFGDAKVKGLGDWQVKYSYRHLEANAFQDFLPDSDAWGGATDIKGSEIEGKLGLAKNVSCGFDYYTMKEINGSGKGKLLQLDLVLIF